MNEAAEQVTHVWPPGVWDRRRGVWRAKCAEVLIVNGCTKSECLVCEFRVARRQPARVR